MPRIDRERIGVAFDMQGCPNRCRHCWLGPDSIEALADIFRQAAERPADTTESGCLVHGDLNPSNPCQPPGAAVRPYPPDNDNAPITSSPGMMR